MSRIDDLIKKHCPDGVKFKKLHKVAKLQRGCSFKISKYSNKGIRVIRVSDVQKGKISDKALRYYPLERQNEVARCLIKENDLVMSLTGNVGRVAVLNQKDLPAGICQDVMRIRANDTSTSTRYLYHFFDQDAFENAAMNNATGACQKHMNPKWFSSYPVPVPPLEVQEEIVRILDTFTKLDAELKAELKARQQQYSHYRDELLSFDGQDIFKDLGTVCYVASGGTPSKTKKEYWDNGSIPWLKSESCNNKAITFANSFITELGLKSSSAKLQKKNTTLIALVGATIFKTAYLEFDATTNQNIASIKSNDPSMLNDKFIFYYITNLYDELKSAMRDYGMLNLTTLRKFKIAVPSLEEQERIVAILDKFDALVNDLSVGLPAEIEARRQQYEHYRNQLLIFKEAC